MDTCQIRLRVGRASCVTCGVVVSAGGVPCPREREAYGLSADFDCGDFGARDFGTGDFGGGVSSLSARRGPEAEVPPAASGTCGPAPVAGFTPWPESGGRGVVSGGAGPSFSHSVDPLDPLDHGTRR